MSVSEGHSATGAMLICETWSYGVIWVRTAAKGHVWSVALPQPGSVLISIPPKAILMAGVWDDT